MCNKCSGCIRWTSECQKKNLNKTRPGLLAYAVSPLHPHPYLTQSSQRPPSPHTIATAEPSFPLLHRSPRNRTSAPPTPPTLDFVDLLQAAASRLL
ncbi:hypothetical protein CIPAW_10G099800 [Carya illinoinensis]|uniref:Uncharacterized protein n=1 Tax=Carya illinoinensis TaxID=32201 RepID=A0A8T1P689_CARIL|nr:hypothetical protein CIPAW_10G099800 [Carya illinoinensis]